MTGDRHSPEAHAAAWQGVAVRYPFARRRAVGPVDLAIRPGERVLLLGASGSGKSTLLLTLTGLIPSSIPARVEGRISLFGADVASRKPWGWAADVAQYFQDADRTLCGMRVEDELAFSLENRALPPACIEEAVTAVMRQVGLPEGWRRRPSAALSGGERQLVALAATLIQDAPLFIADEPTAHLAPEAASRLHARLTSIDPGQSVLIVDHRLDGLVHSIDRMVVLGPEGTVIADGPPRALFREKRDLLTSLGIWCPASSALDVALAEVGLASPVPPLSVAEALAHLDPAVAPHEDLARARPVVDAFVAVSSAPPARRAREAPVVARLAGANCAPFLGPVVLRHIDLTIREGEILGILGANGAGKSTLGLCLADLLVPKAGERTGAPGGFAFQRPENQFVARSVRDEILAALPKKMAAAARAEQVAKALAAWGLSGLENRHPFELSEGQQRRLALATLSASDRWPLLVLDEPMAGLDAHGASTLIREILWLSENGRAIAVITHDMDLALRLCPRCIVLGEGRLLADGPTDKLMDDPGLLKRAGLAEPASAKARQWLRRVALC
jgi:energy-coupling factor transporter ATP-binding protein EcfA2